MGENTKIEWAKHTFNPWIGCTRVSAGCQHCYAEAMMDTRLGVAQWGPKGERVLTSPANWIKPFRWNAAAQDAGERHRVFCASLADVFDDHPSIKPEWRGRLWHMINKTPHLEWLLLTKRPENWPVMLPTPEPTEGFDNVRLGVTIEDQAAAYLRGPVLQFAADLGWKTFVSYEPALGPVDWTPFFQAQAPAIEWLICGGESGHEARPIHPAWARGARDAARAAGVPFHFKQWGEWVTEAQSPEDIVLPGEGRCHFAEAGEDGDWTAGDQTAFYKVGKHRAGASLDGREHREFPR